MNINIFEHQIDDVISDKEFYEKAVEVYLNSLEKLLTESIRSSSQVRINTSIFEDEEMDLNESSKMNQINYANEINKNSPYSPYYSSCSCNSSNSSNSNNSNSKVFTLQHPEVQKLIQELYEICEQTFLRYYEPEFRQVVYEDIEAKFMTMLSRYQNY